MRKTICNLAILVIALLAPRAIRAQQPATTQVIISVSDPTGARVSHAQIRIVPGPDSGPAKLETDDKGRTTISLKPGGYALFVTDPGFKEVRQQLVVGAPEGAAAASQIVPVVLQVAVFDGPVVVYPKDTLVVTADLYHAPVVLSPAEFHALPHVTLAVHNAHTNADESYSGVPLSNLLAMINAPIGKELRGEALAHYVIATGTDGYSAVLSLAEADPDFHGGQIVVADARDGQPLGKNGPFQLIVSEDKHPARWVRNLNSISLQIAH